MTMSAPVSWTVAPYFSNLALAGEKSGIRPFAAPLHYGNYRRTG